MPTLSDFTATALTGETRDLSDYAGDVVLVVNTASKCGLTPQYAGLEQLWRSYRDEGLTVLGFPCNQFGAQEPGAEEEIAEFCSANYGVTFPMFAKVEVNGANAHPLYSWLRSERPGEAGEAIEWNFAKFLLDRSGKVIARFAPATEPSALRPDIEQALRS
jgi:glutathione peroxidase